MKITLIGAILIIVAIIAILNVVNVSTEKPAGSLSRKKFKWNDALDLHRNVRKIQRAAEVQRIRAGACSPTGDRR